VPTPGRPADIYVIRKWQASLVEGGWAEASAKRAASRLQAFATITRDGLLRATRADLIAYMQDRIDAAGAESWRTVINSPGFRQDIGTIRGFYRWAQQRGFMSKRLSPLVGLRLPPTQAPDARITLRDGYLYEKILQVPGITVRDRTILHLLANGLAASEVCRVRTSDANLEAETITIQGTSAIRIIPIGAKTAGHLAAWLKEAHKNQSPWLFPNPHDRRRRLTLWAIRAIVSRAATSARLSPGERRRVHTSGFRDLFLRRSIHARASVELLRNLGVDRLSRIPCCTADSSQPDRLNRELSRLTRRWPRWV
jgi:integrase